MANRKKQLPSVNIRAASTRKSGTVNAGRNSLPKIENKAAAPPPPPPPKKKG